MCLVINGHHTDIFRKEMKGVIFFKILQFFMQSHIKVDFVNSVMFKTLDSWYGVSFRVLLLICSKCRLTWVEKIKSSTILFVKLYVHTIMLVRSYYILKFS